MNPRTMKFMVCALCFAMCLAISVPVRAQVSGATLSGIITDAQGGAVAGAKVSARNLGTNIVSETTTNEAGAYSIPNLIPADYEVSVTAPGFSTTTSRVTLTVGAKQEMNFKLTVGQVSQTVEVTGAALQVDLASSTISGDVNSTQVRELPLNGRDWASLATLQPGVMANREHRDVTQAGGSGGRGLGDQLSISGGRPSQNSYRLDGVIVNDYSNQGPGSVLGANLGVDAIAEFSVLTNSYSAEYGFTSGGVINAITKSGTNSLHGDLFEFVRNDKFDANDFFNNVAGQAKGPLRQNQFGGSGGWRIFKDKTFLFGSYEGVRRIKDVPHSTDNTVSDAVRGGSYATCGPTGSGCSTGTVANLSTCSAPAFVGCTTVTVPIDPSIRKLLPVFPIPNAGVINPNVVSNFTEWAQNANENFFTLRADQKISDKDSVFATYMRDYSTFTTPATLSAVNIAFTSYRQAAIFEWTHIFGPSLVNTVRVGDSRTSNVGGDCPSVNVPAAGDPSLGIKPGFWAPGITLTGTKVTSFGGGLHWCTGEQNLYGQLLQLYDDAGKTYGNHSFKFGFDYLPQELDGFLPLGGSAGGGTFSNLGTFVPCPLGTSCGADNQGDTATAAEIGTATNNCLIPGKGTPGVDNNGAHYDQSCGALVNFLTNQPRAVTQPNDFTVVPKHYMRTTIISGYVQDDWRIRPSFTANLGLRYEISTIPWEVKGNAFFLPALNTNLPCVNSHGLPTPTDETCSVTEPTSVMRQTNFLTKNPTLKNFEPRIGFAWDPFHNGKTAIRAGFGMFDALPLPYEYFLDNAESQPFRSTFANFGPVAIGGVATGLEPSPPQGAFPTQIAALGTAHIINPVARNNWYYIDTNIKRNYVEQFNLNIQRQLSGSTTFTIGYVGSRAWHNPLQAEGSNSILPTKAPASVGGFYYWPFTSCTAGTIAPPGCPTIFPNANAEAGSFNQGALVNPSIGAILATLYEAQSWYDALQVGLNQRLMHGLTAQISFTYSKTLDNSSGSVAADNSSLDAAGNPGYDLSLNKGLSDYNISKNLVANVLWTAPTPKSLGAIAEHALGGWQVGGIITLASGIPEYPALPDFAGEFHQTVNSGSVAAGCTPQNLVNPNYRHNLDYLNLNCFQIGPTATAINSAYCDSPPGSSFGTKTRTLGAGTTLAPGAGVNQCLNIRGNLGRNTISGPGEVNVDLSMFKNNYIPKISENFNLQFRVEFFNAFNHSNFAPPPSGAGSPFNGDGSVIAPIPGVVNSGFGSLTSLQIPNRQIQFALKAIF